MTQAQTLYRDLMPLESEVCAVCEILCHCGRCLETVSYWGERMFTFEDDSCIVFGMLGPYVA